MTRYIYMVESTTEKSNFGFKFFSSLRAAQRFARMNPACKHKITKQEIYSLSDIK